MEDIPQMDFTNWLVGGWEVHIQRRDFAGNVLLMITRRNYQDKTLQYISRDCKVKIIPENEMINPDDLWVLPIDMMQAVTDELAKVGFKSKDRRFEKEIDLLNRHLDDMRGMVNIYSKHFSGSIEMKMKKLARKILSVMGKILSRILWCILKPFWLIGFLFGMVWSVTKTGFISGMKSISELSR